MKSFALSTVVTALGAASAASGIVLPHGSNFSAYTQHFNAHPLPRSADGAEAASSGNAQGRGIKIPMYRHSKRDMKNPDHTLEFARKQLDYVTAKWGKGEAADKKRAEMHQKRQTIGLSDVGQDSFYFGQVGVGTPRQSFNVILDTGSADFWLVDTDCDSTQCTGIALFNPDASSTYKSSTTPFEIQYGTGAVKGSLAADTVSLAGYTVNSQTFAIAEQLADNTLNAPTSGILGLGFESLAQSQATPFWQVVIEQNNPRDPLFTFQIGRNVETANSNTEVNPGGVFTLGELDADQYSGDINYVPLTGQEGYWTIPLTGVSVNGNQGSVSSGSNAAAIDTGTTLIIAPPSLARQIYSQIPNSRSLGSQFSSSSGSYAIPCSSNVNIALTFGGQQYSINSADMNAGAVDRTGQYCLGGILGASLGSGAPAFIVGDVFLKNVFSVYRYSPAAVGFASLKGAAAQSLQTTSGAVEATNNPSATVMSSATGSGNPGIVSSASMDTETSGVEGAGGLPSPSAVGSVESSSATLTPASGSSSSSGDSSGAATVMPRVSGTALAGVLGIAVLFVVL